MKTKFSFTLMLTLVLALSLATSAFASDIAPIATGSASSVTSGVDALENQAPRPAMTEEALLVQQRLNESLGAEMRMPAAQITSVWVEWVGIHNGRFEIDVRVTGHGWHVANFSHGQARLLNRQMLGGTPVNNFRYTFDLGVAQRGSFRFDITYHSHNFPFSSLSTWATWTW